MPVNNALDLADDIARNFEGYSSEPYHDPVGYPTIGYGHLLSRKMWADLSQWESITEPEAEKILQQDMLKAQYAVNRLIHVELTDHQEAALIDFAFNCGSGNLQISTLRRVINRGEYHKAPEQFKRWVYANGIRLNGLIRRRAFEAEFWDM